LDWSAELHYVALVEIAAIPLYLLVRPHLDIWTHDDETEQWLVRCLLPNLNDELSVNDPSANLTRPWWLRPAQQSDRGILLEVMNGASDSGNPGGVITEFLIYATVLKPPEPKGALSTPPASSSPQGVNWRDEGSHEGLIQNIRIRAVPLASTAHPLQYAHQVNQSPTNHLVDGEARFLPAISSNVAAFPNLPPKRQRLVDLFEDAAYQRNRLHRRGGERVSKAMAGLNGPTLSLEKSQVLEPDGLRFGGQVYSNGRTQRGVGELSQAPSISSIRGVEPSRPLSRTQGFADGKTSGLHEVENAASLGKSPLLRTETNKIEEQNKSTLTRIVMAGMRIYGLQYRKKSVKLQMETDSGNDSLIHDLSIPRGEDEYKMVYHHTLKAATFIFRTQLNQELINQATMGDVVDQLLALFCTDPLATESFNSGYARIEDK
jgi:hypothetical protein